MKNRQSQSKPHLPWWRVNWLLCCVSLASTQLAHAEARQMPWQQSPPAHMIEDKFRLEVGAWQTGINTVIRSDATTSQPGSTLDGESDVGLKDKALSGDFELTLLPGERQLYRVHGFSSHRNGSAVLRQAVQYDGKDYAVGDLVKSTLNLDMLGVGYAYRVLKAPRYELALGVDVEIASVETNVYVPRVVRREADAGVLPIPLFDTEGRWEFWRNWQLQGRYRWLGGSGNDGKVSGAMRDWRIGVSWQFNQHLGVGVHYRHFGVDVHSASGSHPGFLALGFSGAELSLRASL